MKTDEILGLRGKKTSRWIHPIHNKKNGKCFCCFLNQNICVFILLENLSFRYTFFFLLFYNENIGDLV